MEQTATQPALTALQSQQQALIAELKDITNQVYCLKVSEWKQGIDEGRLLNANDRREHEREMAGLKHLLATLALAQS
jgi:hypothetical protein